MARLRGFPSQGVVRTSQRRKTAWVPGPASTGTGGLQSITASGKVGWGLAVVTTSEALTLVRTRGELLMFLSAADAVTSGFHGAIGIAKVTAAAFAVGVTAIPGPVTEDSWDGWLYHRHFALIAQNSSPTDGSVISTLRLEIDSKAMRKFQEDEALVAIMEMTEIGVATMRFFANTRMLLKLP